MFDRRVPATELSGVGHAPFVSLGPPWILGLRGAPLEAPENTVASFLRAIDAGADGIHYDLRSSSGGDLVVLHDATLERTTDGTGRVAQRGLSELHGLDAGDWFSKSFSGEPLAYLDDVIAFCADRVPAPMHLIELHDSFSVEELIRQVKGSPHMGEMRVASKRRDVCLELRDAGILTLFLVECAEEASLAFVRDARLSGIAVTTARGWRTDAWSKPFRFERWILGISEASDLFEALRSGVTGVTTSELRRALGLRAMLHLASGQLAIAEPLAVSSLPVVTSSSGDTAGEWRGEWAPRIAVTNSFNFPCSVTLEVFVRRGVFEREQLPRKLELEPGESRSVQFGLRGGSWSPGGDPVVAALFEWESNSERAAGRLLFDAALRRERSAVADVITHRLEMLRESPGQASGSMTIRRRGQRLTLWVENPAGLSDLRSVACVEGRSWFGGSSLQVPLPEGFDELESGMSFACGFYGKEPGQLSETLRRWCGGLPLEPGTGGLGRLFPRRWA
ncbi:MAG: hypothetical protein ACI8X5_002095 [Planctomycetota bacterium]|jgi:hypothetical protein